MRKISAVLFSASFLVSAVALFNCVADEPGTTTSDSDASTSDGAPTGDAAPSNDAAPGTDGAIDPCSGSPNCPSQQNPAHLQLWLRGDLGVDCSSGRVTTWHDQSGHHRDAVGAHYPDGGAALQPHCGGTMNGRSVVTLTAPKGGTDESVDEILNDDFSFLVGTDWTILIVHRPATPLSGSYLEGLLSATWTYPIGTSCLLKPPSNDGTLDLLFASADDGGIALQYNAHQNCHYAGYESNSYAYVPGAATLDVFRFDKSHEIYADGVQVYDGNGEGDDNTGIIGDAGILNPGVIGRESDDGKFSGADYRYSGDMAEIIIYDIALQNEISALNTYVKTTWNIALP